MKNKAILLYLLHRYLHSIPTVRLVFFCLYNVTPHRPPFCNTCCITKNSKPTVGSDIIILKPILPMLSVYNKTAVVELTNKKVRSKIDCSSVTQDGKVETSIFDACIMHMKDKKLIKN